MSTRHSVTEIQAELRAIERRVFEDVWIGRPRTRTLAVLATVLAATAGLSLAQTVGTQVGHWVSLVVVVMFAMAASMSALALVRRKFRWCCLAACLSFLAAVDGAGAFWWHHTALSTAWLPTAAIGSLAGVALTAGWLGVCLAPVTSSQPDMRAAVSYRHR